MIYVDSNLVIRLLEGDAATRLPIENRLLPLRGSGQFLCTSTLTRLECQTLPLRNHDSTLLALYDLFFSGAEMLLLDLTRAVVEKATELRATLNLKTPDALHLASAIIAGSTSFLTGDKTLKRCTEILVELL